MVDQPQAFELRNEQTGMQKEAWRRQENNMLWIRIHYGWMNVQNDFSSEQI